MALFAYVYAFGQTKGNLANLFNALLYEYDEDFAARQLRYGAVRDFLAANDSAISNISEVSPYILVFGNDFDQIMSEFETYLKLKNFTNVYEYVYSTADVKCTYSYFSHHLIRYGRVCQVRIFRYNYLTGNIIYVRNAIFW